MWNDIAYYMYILFRQWVMAVAFSSVRLSFKIGGEIEARGVGVWRIPPRLKILEKINRLTLRRGRYYIKIHGVIYLLVCFIPCMVLFIPYVILLLNGIEFHETLLNIVMVIDGVSFIVFGTITVIQLIIENILVLTF